MEMYTTETIPSADSRPIVKAWLVHCTKERVFEALAGLEEQAAKAGADAVVGLRITRVGAYYMPEVPFTVGGTTSARLSSRGAATGDSCTAYGTAVKVLGTSPPQPSEAVRGQASPREVDYSKVVNEVTKAYLESQKKRQGRRS